MSEYLSKEHVNGVYIPSGLLLVGVAIVKSEWLPYAILLVIVLAGYKVYSTSTYSQDRDTRGVAVEEPADTVDRT
jgi:cytochrome-b5 reductase